MIDKIINYHDKSTRGSWRNMICLLQTTEMKVMEIFI